MKVLKYLNLMNIKNTALKVEEGNANIYIQDNQNYSVIIHSDINGYEDISIYLTFHIHNNYRC